MSTTSFVAVPVAPSNAGLPPDHLDSTVTTLDGPQPTQDQSKSPDASSASAQSDATQGKLHIPCIAQAATSSLLEPSTMGKSRTEKQREKKQKGSAPGRFLA